MTLTIVLAAAAVLVIIDQIIKYFVVQNLAPSGSVSVIDNFLSLTYAENTGVAFGMFKDRIWIFAIVTIVLIAVFVWLIAAKKIEGKLFYFSAALMIGGGVGNLIDRLFRGFVVDYLSLSFFSPVCNFADYCITIGAFLFVIVLLFQTSKEKKKTKEGEETTDNNEASTDEENVSDDSGEKDGD